MAEDREKSKQLIGNMLVEANLLTKEGLEKAILEQKKTKEKFSRILVRLGLVEEEGLVSFLGKKFNIPYINLLTAPIDAGAVDTIHYEIAKKYLLFPCQKENGILTVAMVDPLSTTIINELIVETGYQIKPIIASETAIRKAIKNYYEGGIKKDQAKVKIAPITEGIDVDKIMRQGAEAPLINLVNHILEEAVNAKASDIHIEPYEQTLRIRYRIDGVNDTDADQT